MPDKEIKPVEQRVKSFPERSERFSDPASSDLYAPSCREGVVTHFEHSWFICFFRVVGLR